MLQLYAQPSGAAMEPWALFLALVFQELVFKLSTTGNLWPQMLFVALFSLAMAEAARLACSLLPTRRASKVAKVALMAITGVLFCVEHFVYREFKLFYDLNAALWGKCPTPHTHHNWRVVFHICF